MKVIIDIVPNHVARGYHSIARPDGVEDFGAGDDTSVEWARDNNFYYLPGKDFIVPESPDGYAPLGGDRHPLADGRFDESPARWTGNGARAQQPDFNDWFETVKVNYGVRPDGSYAFDSLPDAASSWTDLEHAAFWADKDVPDSWTKFRDIVLYWLDKGVDGFRYDMAEMVPVEFWSYLNSAIKSVNPDAFLLAEVYNPDLYRDYIYKGRMDYLYDKVGFYDTLKPIMQGRTGTEQLADAHAEVLDIEEHMLHFLENHDEQRIASPDFAGDPVRGKPAMVVSALISRSPTMLYFGQDVGEPGDGDAGFGDPTRTTIFDYWGVPSHQRYMNNGAFDGGQSTPAELELRDFYERLMTFSSRAAALQGEYAELHSHNRQLERGYDDKLFAFARWHGDDRLIVIANFSADQTADFLLELPADLVSAMNLEQGRYDLEDVLFGSNNSHLVVDGETASLELSLAPLDSAVLRIADRDIVRHASVASEFVDPRHVDVYLPRGYHESGKRYAVVYAHDGQNLFNPGMSFTGIDWGIDEAVESLLAAGAIDDVIVVGIWNTPKRGREYQPQFVSDALPPDTRQLINEFIGGQPLSDDYLRFVVTELKPFIDANYSTRTGRDHTFLLGSSMGGLISMYGVQEYPEVFGGAACLSTHWPAVFGEGEQAEAVTHMLDRLAERMAPLHAHRWYFDYGTTELDAVYEQYQLPVDARLRKLGYAEGKTWLTRKYDGAGHAERYWRERVHVPLSFLLGK
jgi:enterochelin esterase-like enzyme/glycosidase